MNVNHTLTCTTCDGDTDVRFGLSNREVQPLRFPCPHCGSRIDVTFEVGQGFRYDGAVVLIERQPKGPFENKNPFVDLHLDFPVWSNKYVIGDTPFMIAMTKVEAKDAEKKLELLGRHGARVLQLDSLAGQSRTLHQVIRLYFGKNHQLFAKRVSDILSEAGRQVPPGIGADALLYGFVSYVFEPFVDMHLHRQKNSDFLATIRRIERKDQAAFKAMLDRFNDSGFLLNLQRDCLDLYPEIFGSELAMRAALFLDITEDKGRGVAARISTADFRTYKDLYKDVAEVFGRQLIIVAALNNLDKRGDADSFLKPKDGNALSSLDKMADKTLSDRFRYLDDSWYPVDAAVVDTGVRNAIAHALAEYDEASQLVTFYPEKEGIRQEKAETMYLLDFMRMILLLFREMHALHFLVKALVDVDR